MAALDLAGALDIVARGQHRKQIPKMVDDIVMVFQETMPVRPLLTSLIMSIGKMVLTRAAVPGLRFRTADLGLVVAHQTTLERIPARF